MDERKLTGGEKRSKEAHFKKLKKHREDFEDRYGKDGEAIMHAIATNRAKKENIDNVSTKTNMSTRRDNTGRVKNFSQHSRVSNAQGTTDLYKTSATTPQGKSSFNSLVKPDGSYTNTRRNADGTKSQTRGYDAIFKHRAPTLNMSEDEQQAKVKGYDTKTITALADLKLRYPHAPDTLAAMLRAIEDIKAASKGDDRNIEREIDDLEARIKSVEAKMKRHKTNEVSDEETARLKDKNPALLKALRSIEATFSPERKKADDKRLAMARAIEMLGSERFKDRAMNLVEPYGITSKEDLLQHIDAAIADEEQAKANDKEGLISGIDRNIAMLQKLQQKVTQMEGYYILPQMDREKYQARDGLEGPIMTKSGKVVYYDPKAGEYYDPDTDMYISYDDFRMLDEARSKQLHDIQWPDKDEDGDSAMAQHAENAIRHGMHAHDAYGHVYSMTPHRDWLEANKEELIAMFAGYGLEEGFIDTVKNVAGKVGGAIKNFVTPGAVKQARKKPVGNKGSLAKQINMPGFTESSGEETVKVLRNIVDQKQAMKVHGMLVDMFTASAIVQVFDKVNDENQKKITDMLQTADGLRKIADFAISKVG